MAKVIWHYDPIAGNDSTGDGTRKNPFKTLAKCKAEKWETKDMVKVKLGNEWYVCSHYKKSGTIDYSFAEHRVNGELRGYKYDDISGDGVNP